MCWAGWSKSCPGKLLDEFFAQRILAPLGMNDTSFGVEGEDLAGLINLFEVRWE